MRKIYTTVLSVLLVGAANAQVASESAPVKRSNDRTEYKKPAAHGTSEEKVVIWSNTFANPADWVIAHDAANFNIDWQIGNVSCTGGYPLDDIQSTTANDGWALMDSDAGNNSSPDYEDAWLTTANPIDLNGYPNVVVEFETYYRPFNNERPYLVVGIGDGAGNVTWPDLDPTTVVTGMNNVFPLFDNQPVNTATDNPLLKQVNISSALVGLTPTELADIYIRFNWTGIWGYAWFVDDIAIIEQPLDDVQMMAAWIAGENNEGTEYGRYPDTQLDANWYVGAEIYNFGVNNQTNVALTADFISFNSTANDPLLLSDSTIYLENLESPALTTGLYEGTYSVVSDNETAASPEYYNNVGYRNMEVTTGVYSQDGIGVHPTSELTLSSLGTNSFTPDSDDGFVMASWYHIKQPMNIEAIEIQLANGTEVGGDLFVGIVDTLDFFNGNMNYQAMSTMHNITSADIAAGFKKIYFPSVVTLNPGCYYAAVEMYSFAGASDIRILNDMTVAQPFWASAIFIPGDQSYTNGDAFGIRLIGENVGLDESVIDGVSVYPNPSEGLITVTNDKGLNNSIEVFSITGEVIFTGEVTAQTTIDLSDNGAGVYLVKVSNETGSLVERVVIK